MKGASMTVDQVLEEVLKDAAFYANSGGGMSLGGGEPLAQGAFAAAILQAAKAKGVHTAVETAGHVPWESFEKVLPYTDLFLYDLKHMDPEVHRQWIGQDNRLILSNLEKLSRRTRNIILRTPVIPGFNDNEADIVAIARQGRLLGIKELHLLPFHRFGEGKYRLLDREPFQAVRSEITKEEMEALKRRAEQEGLQVQVGG
jgi:pyruvate formate lyase activating enzyme